MLLCKALTKFSDIVRMGQCCAVHVETHNSLMQLWHVNQISQADRLLSTGCIHPETLAPQAHCILAALVQRCLIHIF